MVLKKIPPFHFAGSRAQTDRNPHGAGNRVRLGVLYFGRYLAKPATLETGRHTVPLANQSIAKKPGERN